MSRTAGNEADGGARRVERDEESGPLAIAIRDNAAAHSLPVKHIGALSADEIEELTLISDPAARGLRGPIASPPPLPQRAADSIPSALQAYYEKRPHPSDRAEIKIEDLALDFTNPFVGSSLLPAPRKKRPWLRPALIIVAAGLLVGTGYASALVQLRDGARPGLERRAVVHAPAVQPVAAAAKSPEPNAAMPVSQPTAAGVAVHAELPASVAAAEPRASAPVPVLAAPPQAQPARVAVPSQPAVTQEQPEVAAAAAVDSTSDAPPAPSAEATVAEAPAPASALPSRAEVQLGLESVRSALQDCAAGGHGRMTANVTISGAGRVTYSTIEGAFAGTPQGSCMALALRAAQFPPFTSAQLRVRYPFAF